MRSHPWAGSPAAAWARGRNLRLDDSTELLVAGYLRSARFLRLLGVLAGVVVTPALAWVLGDQDLGLGYLAAVSSLGYLAGTLIAELRLARRGGPGAAVRQRRLDDYLSPTVRRAQWRVAAAAVAISLAMAVLPGARDQPAPVLRQILIAVAAAVCFASIVLLQRWVVGRPQSTATSSALSADDALRVQSVHSIASAGIGIQCLLAGSSMWLRATATGQAGALAIAVGALLIWAAGLTACTYFDRALWQVRSS